MKYKHIIWDWNGTLLDDVCLSIECMNKMLEKRNMKLINKDEYRELVNIPIIHYYEKLGFDFGKEPFKELSYEFLKEFDSRIMECSLHESCIETLDVIRQKGISQSVLSATNKSTLYDSLEKYRILNYFNYVIGQDDHFAGSKIEKGKRLIEKLGVNPSKVLLIGDITHDYDVGEAIKCDAILVSNGHHSEKRLRGCCSVVANNLEEIRKILFGD